MTAVSGPEILRNRFLQKKFANGCGIATTDFRLARNHANWWLRIRLSVFPGPQAALQSPALMGKDRGSFAISTTSPRALQETQGRPLLWERFVDIDFEFSIRCRTLRGRRDRISSPQPRFGDPNCVLVRAPPRQCSASGWRSSAPTPYASSRAAVDYCSMSSSSSVPSERRARA